MRDILLYFSMLHAGEWQKIYRSIEKKELVDFEKLKSFKATLNCGYMTIIDADYPDSLKQGIYPPYVIYYLGDKDLINQKKKIAMVGSRDYSLYGEEMAIKLTKQFVGANYIIVSGAAKGIDIIAQKACLQAGGKTIAVVGSGLNHYYPSENKLVIKEIEQVGLVISEYPPDVMANKTNFPNRNRLIASLSEAIIVVEAKSKSGTLITVRHALDVGKDIYCVPYHATEDSMCNELIKQGANLIEDYTDYKK